VRPPVFSDAVSTLANLLTFSRLPAMFAIVALMHARFPWAATVTFWLFIAAALTDWLDGMVARNSGTVSLFGRFMDAVIDKVMVLGLMIALLQGDYFRGHQVIALALLLVILCREFTVSGLRMVAATKGLIVEADSGGKMKTLVQLNAIGFLLGEPMVRDDIAPLLPVDLGWFVSTVRFIGLSLYVLSAVLSVTSGWTYFRKYGRVLTD
jgi:CDP-diacylglycerol--glycerol-3-phosphate 3-phosphatidyltransferase